MELVYLLNDIIRWVINWTVVKHDDVTNQPSRKHVTEFVGYASVIKIKRKRHRRLIERGGGRTKKKNKQTKKQKTKIEEKKKRRNETVKDSAMQGVFSYSHCGATPHH